MPEGTYNTRVFSLNNTGDKEDYEEIMQNAVLDEDNVQYEILSEAGHWTQEGDRVIHLSWIEREPDEEPEERF